jgi:MFS transporter, NNP family, nitrate/nitrite transporter
MGISALVCASLCAFFLQEPRGSFAEDYGQPDSPVVAHNTIPALLQEQE